MFDRVKPGDDWQPEATEVNAMLEAAAAFRQAPGVRPGNGPTSRRLMRPQLVRVKNNTGAAVDRYSTYALGPSRWALGAGSNLNSAIFALETYAEGDPIAIVQEPLTVGAIGRAAIFGATIVEVTSDGTTANRRGTPNASGLVVPNDDGPITLLEARPTGGGYIAASIPCVPCATGCGDYGETWYLKFCDSFGSCEIFNDLVGTEVTWSSSAPGVEHVQLVTLSGLLPCGTTSSNQLDLRLTVYEGTPNRYVDIYLATADRVPLANRRHFGTGCDIFDVRMSLQRGLSIDFIGIQLSKSSAITCDPAPPPPI